MVQVYKEEISSQAEMLSLTESSIVIGDGAIWEGPKTQMRRRHHRPMA